MYMAIRYEGGDGVPDLELTDNRSLIVGTSSGAATAYMGLLTTILEWHAFDPPDAAELERNEIVYSFQNNRNPFIDHPEWGTLALFQSSQPAECILGTPSNGAPVAVDDAYAASQDVALVVPAVNGVLANDSDPDADALTAQLLANAASGIVSLATDGSFTYTADAGFCGDDSFTYSASDGTAASAAALVSLTVACTLPDAVFKDGFE
jgi:VCBS repeat-containing protein